MRLTVDASVAVKWVVDEDRRELARDVLREGFELFAPDLMLTEVANALRSKVRAEQIEFGQARAALIDFPRYFDRLIGPMETLNLAFELACQVNHPVADCVYLACAMRSSMVLLTDDAAQYQKSKILGPNMRAVHLRDWTLGLPADSTG